MFNVTGITPNILIAVTKMLKPHNVSNVAAIMLGFLITRTLCVQFILMDGEQK